MRQELPSVKSSENVPYLHPQMQEPTNMRQRGRVINRQLPDERGKQEKADFQNPAMLTMATEEPKVTVGGRRGMLSGSCPWGPSTELPHHS